MMRVVGIIAVLIALAAGLAYLTYSGDAARTEVLSPPSQSAAVAPTTLTGTLTYYPNNQNIEVPYLVYKNTGTTETKALVFGSDSSCVTQAGTYPCPLIADALSTYVGANAVQVEGTIIDEHLLVSSLSD